MYTKKDIIPSLVEASPGFQKVWDEYLKDWKDQEPGVYNEISEFISYLYEKKQNNQIEDFSSIFQLVETLIAEGDDGAKEAMVVGFLEDLQNRTLNEDHQLSEWESYLKPETLKQWRRVDAFWKGKVDALQEG